MNLSEKATRVTRRILTFVVVLFIFSYVFEAFFQPSIDIGWIICGCMQFYMLISFTCFHTEAFRQKADVVIE